MKKDAYHQEILGIFCVQEFKESFGEIGITCFSYSKNTVWHFGAE